MVSSDDEGENVPQAVSNYYFEDENDEPISFAELEIQWCEGESANENEKQIFLKGDDGLQKLYRKVTAWKFDLSCAKPKISVLTKENNWIRLEKPRKSFEGIIRTILITIHCLHYLKKNPEASGKSLWDHLAKIFSLYEVLPSENDLVDHVQLISEAVKTEESLKNCKYLLTFLEEKPKKRKMLDEVTQPTSMAGFIVDDTDDDCNDGGEEDGSDDEDMYDSVCAFCDNGGELLCCEGRCMRSFHATKAAGKESMCVSLGLTDDDVEAMPNFYCKNCEFQKHQCFACGKLGSSDKSAGAEVFPCVSATCGHFYHPHCVAILLYHNNEAAAEELQQKISAGESFICPVHKCCVCKQGENKKDPDLQFAVCRRCPKSYHRKCLPRKIAFEDSEEEDIIPRAWEKLLPNRILIYCLKHEIYDGLGTPKRNHVKFPDVEVKHKIRESDLRKGMEKDALKRKSMASSDVPWERTGVTVPQQVKKLSSAVKEDGSTKLIEKRAFVSEPKKLKVASQKAPRCSITSASEIGKTKKQDQGDRDIEQVEMFKPARKSMSSLPCQLDPDSERRLLALMKESASSLSLEKIREKHKAPSTHAYSSKSVVDKTITQGKVEGAVEALRTALQKLEAGCSIEEVKAVCEPEILYQMFKWKNKLKVYLAPFLHGMRYTSYGRHFTTVDKLEQIVDKLHWYVQNGDMIVDFCCGANDFSWLMKRKLEEMGKKCSYKNYDIFPAKNDFNFEKRDWMKVKPKELTIGSQLIMGLNPPFGVEAALANQFINKALEFKPKLLILIVPRETKRLERKKTPYDLIWEDNELLSGKSFYLPGSVDENDKQMGQWNLQTPPLYLWSRHDWTVKHKAIAEKHGHQSRLRDHYMTQVPDHPLEDCAGQGDVPMAIDNDELGELQIVSTVTEAHRQSSPGDRESHENGSHWKNQSSENSKKRKHANEQHRRGSNECYQKKRRGLSEVSSEDRKIDRRPPTSEAYRGTPHDSNLTRGRSSSEGHPSYSHELPPQIDVNRDDYQHLRRSSGSGLQFGAGHDSDDGAIRADDTARRYSLNNEQPYSNGTPIWPRGSSPVADGFGYRPYSSEIGERYGRESEIRASIRQFGQQDRDSFTTHRSSYLAGRDPGFGNLSFLPPTYSHLGSAPEPPYERMNTSAMQRYAPRLDELNHTRRGSFGADPSMVSRNGFYNNRAPQSGYQADSMGFAPPAPHHPRATQSGYQADSMGFAPAPHHAYSHHSSSGWLNE